MYATWKAEKSAKTQDFDCASHHLRSIAANLTKNICFDKTYGLTFYTKVYMLLLNGTS